MSWIDSVTGVPGAAMVTLQTDRLREGWIQPGGRNGIRNARPGYAKATASCFVHRRFRWKLVRKEAGSVNQPPERRWTISLSQPCHRLANKAAHLIMADLVGKSGVFQVKCQ